MNLRKPHLISAMALMTALLLPTTAAWATEGDTISARESPSGQSLFRTWVDNSGRPSRVPLMLVAFDEAWVTLQDADGKTYTLGIERLADEERKRLKRPVSQEHSSSVRIDLVSMNQPGGEPAAAQPAARRMEVKLEPLRAAARQPVVVERTVEEAYTVTTPISECVPVVERYGPCGRCCRIVYRRVIRHVPQQRTRSKIVAEAYPTVAEMPVDERSESIETVVLPTPRSAGAIAEEVRALIDERYPQEEFPLARESGSKPFPVLYTALPQPAGDGVRYQFVIERAADPSVVTIMVYAHEMVSKSAADSQKYSDDRLQEIKDLLTLPRN